MRVEKLVVGAVMTNCYIVSDEATKDALVIDPGAGATKIAGKIREEELALRAILLTHGHFDHIWGVEELQKLSGAKLYAYEEVPPNVAAEIIEKRNTK